LDEKVAEEMKSCKASKREEIKVHYSVESTCYWILYVHFSCVDLSSTVMIPRYRPYLIPSGLIVMWSYCDVVLLWCGLICDVVLFVSHNKKKSEQSTCTSWSLEEQSYFKGFVKVMWR